MISLEEKVFDFIKEYQMLEPGKNVVAGVSGGADSVCLLLVLLEWKRKNGGTLTVVHVHHGIRTQAEEDARFVEALCRAHEIPFLLERADVPALAAQWNCGEEEAGRRFRYEAFERAASESGADRIAVAHNLNDLGETMLFHLFRGSGIRGLCGIPAVRGKIIRPLLCVERKEIETYLGELGQSFCKDHTNEEDAYTRNRIRHHILPYAEENIVSGCVQHMGQTARLLTETEEYLTERTKDALAACVKTVREKETYELDCKAFAGLHSAIRKRVLYELLKDLSPGAKDITTVHVEAFQELILREGNREIQLPFGIRALREYDRVRLEICFPERNVGKPVSWPKWEADFQVLLRRDIPIDEEKNPIFPENEYTKWFDYDKMKKSPIVRTRAEGDYLTIRDKAGTTHHKKLKEYMVNEKIPVRERDHIPVVAEDSHVLWLVGYRISEYYKVTERTERILQVQIRFSQEEKDCNSSPTEEEYGGAY